MLSLFTLFYGLSNFVSMVKLYLVHFKPNQNEFEFGLWLTLF